MKLLKSLLPFLRRRPVDHRYGGRASILQVGSLVVGERRIDGVIQNVGLRGAYFGGRDLPRVGEQGTLIGPGGRPIEVRVVSRRRFGNPGVGLAFTSA